MVFSVRLGALRAAPRFALTARPTARAFSISSVRALKESDVDNPSSDKEKHKQDQLDKQKEGKNHWKPELASDSEEAVAADRHDHSDHSEDGLKGLQEKTKGHPEEKHK